MSLYRRLLETTDPQIPPRANGPWENKRPGLPAAKNVIPPEHILAVVRAAKEAMPEKLRAARYLGSTTTGIRDALQKHAPQDYGGLSHVHGAGAVRAAVNKLVKAGKLVKNGNFYREPPTASEKAAVDAKANLKAQREKQASQIEAHAKKALGAAFVSAVRRKDKIRLTVDLDLSDPNVLKKINGLT